MARPGSTSPDGRLLHQQALFDPARLQIRVVPYSPPRLSSDGEPGSHPLSYSDGQPPTSPDPQIRKCQPDNDLAHRACSVNESRGQNTTGSECLMDGTTETYNTAAADSPAVNWATVSPTPDPGSPSPSYRRQIRTITVNSDKTFSLLPQSYSSSSATESLRSPRRSSAAPSSSADRTISGTFVEDQPSSPLTPLEELSRPPSSYCSTPSPLMRSSLAAEESTSSPWNYTLVGGVRKVPNSAKESKGKDLPIDSISARRNLQTALAESGPSASSCARDRILATKPSFNSTESVSTQSERSNYKTFPSDSPCLGISRYLETPGDANADLPSASHSNFEIIGESSSERSLGNRSRSDTNASEKNYTLHDDFTSSPAPALGLRSGLRTEYSRESLVVAPLRPGKRFISDNVGLSRQKSTDSVRTGSLTSLSSALVEEAARSLFAGSTVVSSRHSNPLRQTSSRRSLPFGPGNHHLALSHHQWSTTLSPVLSESDRVSVVPSLALSHSTAGDRRRQSNFSGTPCLSPDDDGTEGDVRVDLLNATSYRAWNREVNSSSLRLIRDQDEHGDGLAELEELHRRPSRTRLHSYLANWPSDRNLRSSGSSRSNSFSRSHIPAWAKLYYGSGERRFLTIQHSSDSLFSEFNASVHNSPLISRSPSLERFISVSQLPPRRPQPPAPCRAPSPSSQAVSDVSASYPPLNLVHRVKKQTSSLWSPHLRPDRRSHRYSLWRPPPAVWVKEEHNPKRNNVQAALFVLGFVFPFAWMLASFLPLPPVVPADMKEKSQSTSQLDLEQGGGHPAEKQKSTNCYNRAKWWRNLNRYMSVIGVLLVGAAIALIITGTQQWKP